TKVFGKEKSLKPAFAAFPFALFTGICFSTCYVIINMLIGFEFASLLGSLISLPIVIFAAKKGFLVPKKLWTFQEGEIDKKDAVITSSPIEDHPIGFIKAWFPYIIIAIILLVTRIDALGLKELLQKSIFVIKFDSLFGYPELSYHFRWAYLPGTVFILVALITHLLHKMNHHQIKEAWTVTIKQVGSATIALLFGVAFVQIMRYSSLNEGGMPSMLMSMANTLAKVGRIAYIVISPFIGVLGSFISGSNTISNVLFTTLQYEVATQIDLFPAAIVSMQINGGAIGNMVCINNAVAVCATLGIVGKEGKLIKTNVIPMILYTLLLIIVVGIGMILFT
ncbi:MAG: L-lactate permease, partial [Bacilli bacterium]